MNCGRINRDNYNSQNINANYAIMKYQNINYSAKDNIAEIILNRREKMNSLDEILISELTEIFNNISNDENIKVAVISGAGGNFCSGLYLDYLQKISGYDLVQNKTDSHRFKDMLLSIYNCSKPVIAKVSGYALAGGCGIATCCDFIVADETAKFGYSEVKIGFIPAIVMVFLLKRVSENWAKDLLLSSRLINSEEALRMGLITRVVKNDEIDKIVKQMCDTLVKYPSISILQTKEMLRIVPDLNFDKALEYACDENASIRMTEDFKTGLSNFLNRNK
jgi:methylglutaconyl-CoA hydratase